MQMSLQLTTRTTCWNKLVWKSTPNDTQILNFVLEKKRFYSFLIISVCCKSLHLFPLKTTSCPQWKNISVCSGHPSLGRQSPRSSSCGSRQWLTDLPNHMFTFTFSETFSGKLYQQPDSNMLSIPGQGQKSLGPRPLLPIDALENTFNNPLPRLFQEDLAYLPGLGFTFTYWKSQQMVGEEDVCMLQSLSAHFSVSLSSPSEGDCWVFCTNPECGRGLVMEQLKMMRSPPHPSGLPKPEASVKKWHSVHFSGGSKDQSTPLWHTQSRNTYQKNR